MAKVSVVTEIQSHSRDRPKIRLQVKIASAETGRKASDLMLSKSFQSLCIQ